MAKKSAQLKPHFGLLTLVLYGVGDILGAGIYALVGKIAGIANVYAWLSFGIAMIAATITALSYAELSVRFPHSGGVAMFVQKSFHRRWLSSFVGWLMLCSCLASMATISKAFYGYLSAMIPWASEWWVIPSFFVTLAIVNYRGMKDSSLLNIICTTIEVSGLMIVIFACAYFLFGKTDQENSVSELTASLSFSEIGWIAILQGASLSFFAFVGFEDIVNVAEETKNPEKNLPKGILLSLGIAGLIYIIIALLVVQVLSPQQLAESKAPLLSVVQKGFPSFPVLIFTIISGFAVINTTLLNYITASRLIYGMGKEGIIPKFFAKLGQRSTPDIAILSILPVVLALALTGAIQYLAGTTATLMLTIFIFANLALLKTRLSSDAIHSKVKIHIPKVIPAFGLLINVVLIIFASRESHFLALFLSGVGTLLVLANEFVLRSRKV